MDIGLVMNTLRDPAGVPAHPVLFQMLMLFTWIFHIAFVHLALGASGLSIYSFHRRQQGVYWQRMSIAMTKVAKVSVSLLIVLGVAPLLFTQVIYDPQWYVSNVLSGRWVIGFIVTLIIGYCSWFIFYYVNKEGAKKYVGCFAWIALALFCLDGLIMHALSYQSIMPEQWMTWYAPSGIVDNSGSALHAIQWPRYIFIMSLSVPAVGLFLIAYAKYFENRNDFSAEYRLFASKLGQRLTGWGFLIALVPLLIWQFSHPLNSQLVLHPVGWLLTGSLIALILWSRTVQFHSRGYLPVLSGFGILTLLSVWREIIRVQHLTPLGYSVDNYVVHTDLPSTALFFMTLVGIGGLVGGFFLTLLYRSGRVQGQYVADASVSRLGSASVGVLILWIAAFFAYGIIIWLKNTFSF